MKRYEKRSEQIYAIALHQRQTHASRKDDCNWTLDQSNYFRNLVSNTGLKIRILLFYANINIQGKLQVDASARRAPTCF